MTTKYYAKAWDKKTHFENVNNTIFFLDQIHLKIAVYNTFAPGWIQNFKTVFSIFIVSSSFLQSGLCSSSELETSRGSIRIQHLTATSNTVNGSLKAGIISNCKNSTNAEHPTRFPRIEDCAHFHYDFTDIGPLVVSVSAALRVFFPSTRHRKSILWKNQLFYSKLGTDRLYFLHSSLLLCGWFCTYTMHRFIAQKFLKIFAIFASFRHISQVWIVPQ